MPDTTLRPMDRLDRVHPRRGLSMLAASMLAAAFVALMAPTAHASLGACRSDPVAILSNGVIVDLFATIGDSGDDVQQVLYTLHAPRGTSLISVVYTSGILGPREALRFSADGPTNTYATETVVTTGVRGIQVTATTTVVPLLDLPATASTQGYDLQTLHVSVST